MGPEALHRAGPPFILDVSFGEPALDADAKRTLAIFLQSIHDPMNSISDQVLSEIDNQSQFQTGQPQVGQGLSLKSVVVVAGRFAFANNQAVNDEIDS